MTVVMFVVLAACVAAALRADTLHTRARVRRVFEGNLHPSNPDSLH